MKDLLPLTSIPTRSNAELTTPSTGKAVAETGLNGIISGIPAKPSDDGVNFLDSFHDLVQARLTPEGTAMPADNGGKGGKALPLSTQAAEAIRPTLSPSVAEEQLQTNAEVDVMTALPLPMSTAGGAPAETLATAASLSGPAMLNARVVPQALDTAVNENSLAMVNKSVTAEQQVARDTVQATNTMQNLNSMNTSESPVIMQLSTMRPLALAQGFEKSSGTIKHDLTPGSKPTPAPASVELVDRQQVLTADGVLNETDRLFTSRMQSMNTASMLEQASLRAGADTLMNATQPQSADVVNASLLRSPLPQSSVPTDSMTANSQSFIPETLGKADWGQGMSKQIMWMVNQSISRAEIRLNPANLGPLEVLIDMENDQVNVAFSSRHADVREAVEQALPRLREMLEEKGLNLSNTDVSQHSFAEQRQNAFAQADQNNNGFSSGHSSEVRDDQPSGEAGQTRLTQALDDAFNNGMVDYYI